MEKTTTWPEAGMRGCGADTVQVPTRCELGARGQVLTRCELGACEQVLTRYVVRYGQSLGTFSHTAEAPISENWEDPQPLPHGGQRGPRCLSLWGWGPDRHLGVLDYLRTIFPS